MFDVLLIYCSLIFGELGEMWCDTSAHKRYPLIMCPIPSIESTTAVVINSLVVIYAISYQCRFEGSILFLLFCACLKNGRLDPVVALSFVCINHDVSSVLHYLIPPLLVLRSLLAGWGDFDR